jgi:hypothetical protein
MIEQLTLDYVDPLDRLVIHAPARTRARDIAEVYCRACGQRLTVGVVSQVDAAVDLAYRNATARPCCDQWRSP